MGNCDHHDRFEGYLKKWTNYVKQYQRRWFVYENGYLTYYRHRSEVGEVVRAQVHLLGCSLNQTGNYGFTINKNHELLFSLRAESRADYDNWLTVIGKAIIRCNELASSPNQTPYPAAPASPPVYTYASSSEFLDQVAVVQENVVQLHISADLLQRSVSRVLNQASLNDCDNLSMYESLSSFRDLNDKTLNSLLELVRRAQLLSDCAANYQATLPVTMSHPIFTDPDLSGKRGSGSEDNRSNSSHESFFDVLSEDESLQPSESNPRPVARAKSSVDVHESVVVPGKQYRTSIPDRPAIKINLWSILSSMMDKDLSRMALPVNFNEPISMLQRISESLEYSHLLDKATLCEDPLIQMTYIVAFAISNYYTTAHRTNKPFNPLLGETYENDRRGDLGWRCICEQVSHHPPVCTLHAEGDGWVLWETYDVKSRFLPTTSLEIKPKGLSQLVFTRTGFRYSWNKVTTYVQNIIVGKLRIEQSGVLNVTNHSTDDRANIEFFTEGWLSSKDARKVEGYVFDAKGERRHTISGYWNNFVDSCKLKTDASGKQIPVDRTVLWRGLSLPKEADKYYKFSAFTCSLNQPDPSVAPTDSRNRQDQRAMENGDFDSANSLKTTLENNQRARRNKIIKEAITMGRANSQTSIEELREPLWFKVDSTVAHETCPIYVYKGGYWEAKSKGDFSMCPHIFDISTHQE
ncbi:Oxysterol-binding protein 2 [Thelohanellus kitauei]|uniref:Oxysterol-binding protein 2 n=1 Tax=Thelohanellus kitauei TaxID=669202 RepID=A0A0C2MB83_THEKT|nr:Oxysterol-binding protein 2 [Thelohanellus kitauei]